MYYKDIYDNIYQFQVFYVLNVMNATTHYYNFKISFYHTVLFVNFFTNVGNLAVC